MSIIIIMFVVEGGSNNGQECHGIEEKKGKNVLFKWFVTLLRWIEGKTRR